MPKRTDISSILIIRARPIVIGHGASSKVRGRRIMCFEKFMGMPGDTE